MTGVLSLNCQSCCQPLLCEFRVPTSRRGITHTSSFAPPRGLFYAKAERPTQSAGAANVITSGQVSGDQTLHHQFGGSGFRHTSVSVRTIQKPSSGFTKPCASNRRLGNSDTSALSPKQQQQQQQQKELLARTSEAPFSAKDISSASRSAQEFNETSSASGNEGQKVEGSSGRGTHSVEKRLAAGRDKANMLFGVEMSPDTVAIAMVYFVQGILGLSRLAVSFFLKDDLHLDPAETAFLSGLSALPWLIKPLYGFISDGVPLFGYRRRSYLVLCGLLGAVSWGSLALFVDNKYAATALILLSSLSVAFSDVVVDSMVVERARGESQGAAGSLQSLCWGSSATGGIVSAYFSGSLVETYGTRFVFGVTAILPLITSAVAGLVREEPSRPAHEEPKITPLGATKAAAAGLIQQSKSQLVFLWETVREPSILWPTLFIFMWQATPTSETAMFFFTTNTLGFGPEFLGRVRLVTAVASLVGVGVYNSYLKTVPLRKIFLWTTLLGTALGSTQLLLVTRVNQTLGITDEWFAMGDSLILTVLGQVSFMPILVLAARLCPPGVEATLFATLMSISNGGGLTGGVLGAGLTGFLGVTSKNFDNLAILLVICNLSSLLPLPFLNLLPSESELEATVEKAERNRADVESFKEK